MNYGLDPTTLEQGRDVARAFRYFGALQRAGVRRVWMRDDLYGRVLRLFYFEGKRPPDGFVPAVAGVEIYRKAERPCATAHTWTHDYGDDWTPERGTLCDCRQKRWGIE